MILVVEVSRAARRLFVWSCLEWYIEFTSVVASAPRIFSRTDLAKRANVQGNRVIGVREASTEDSGCHPIDGATGPSRLRESGPT